jgi:ribosomal protein L29
MQRGSGQDAKPHLFNSVKKNIARVKTIINQKLGDK